MSLIQIIGSAYLIIGGIVMSLSMGSMAIYFGFGPGAFWNIGFLPWIFGGVSGIFFAFLRFVTWPYGLYLLIDNPDNFIPWLFYHWY